MPLFSGEEVVEIPDPEEFDPRAAGGTTRHEISGTVHGSVLQATSVGSVIVQTVVGAGSAAISCVVGLLIFLSARLLGFSDWRIGVFIALGTLGVIVINRCWRTSRWQAWCGVALSVVSLVGSLTFAVKATRSAPVSGPAVREELLAYTTDAGVFLAEAGQVDVTRIESFLRGEVVKGLSWSSDGRYVAGTMHLSDKSTRVWAYDVREGHSVEWPECTCSHAGFVGGELLAIRGDELAVFSFNFDAPRFLTPAEIRLSDANVIGPSADGMVVAVPDPTGTSAYGGPEDVYAIKPDGTAKRLYGTGSNKAITMPSTRGDSEYLAWKTGWRNGHCEDYEYVRAFHTANASTYEIESLDQEPAWMVFALRWSRDQARAGSEWVLYSVQMSTTVVGSSGVECVEGDRLLLRSTADGQWEQVSAPSDVLEGVASASGVLAVRTGRVGAVDGDLMIIRGGVREPLGTNVAEMAWST